MENRHSIQSIDRRNVLAGLIGLFSGCLSSSRHSDSFDMGSDGIFEWSMAGRDLRNSSNVKKSIDIGSFSDFRLRRIYSNFLTDGIICKDGIIFGSDERIVLVSFSGDDIHWSTDLPGKIGGSPLLFDDTVVVPRDPFGEGFGPTSELSEPQLHGININTGDKIWSVELIGRKLYSAIRANNNIYIQSNERLYKLSKEGEIIWNQSFEGEQDLRGHLSPVRPVVGKDMIFAHCQNGLCGFDKSTGKLQWQTGIKNVRYTPVLTTNGILVLSNKGTTIGIDTDRQEKIWKIDERSYQSPASSGSTVIIPLSSSVCAVDEVSGEKKWDINESSLSTPPVIIGDTVVSATSKMELIASDITNGSQITTTDTTGLITSLIPTMKGMYTAQIVGDKNFIYYIKWN